MYVIIGLNPIAFVYDYGTNIVSSFEYFNIEGKTKLYCNIPEYMIYNI